MGHHHRHLTLAGTGQGLGQLRPAVQRIGAFAGFHLHHLGHHLAAFGGGKAGNGFALRFDAQAALALLARRNPDVTYNLAHQLALKPAL